ncbi:MAG TPA: aminotransferase class V-fold PLP-dependent enzyme [Ideonella sp.]|nr:aminotransferase class V-fold PLP-dependent enzyme [Ideonella sp.]
MRELLFDGADRAARYLEGLDSRAVQATLAAIAALEGFEEPLPAQPQEAAATLAMLDTLGSPATMANAGGRFFGFVVGGALPVTLAAQWLASAWDQNAALHTAAPAAARIEAVALRWLLSLFGLPATAGGAFVTGATMANLTGLAAARHAVLRREGWSVEAQGLFGAPPITVLVGDEVHPTLVKSLGLLGLGRERVVRIPVDGQGRLRADRLPPLAGPTIVCLQAGNVNTGAFDPFEQIVPAARAAGAWVHVDGAFGLWARASPAHAPLAAGLEAADSWATDAHKWLNVPYDCGVALVRDGEALHSAMSVTADYLPAHSLARDPSDTTPELSRRARGVEVWAALRTLGIAGIAELVERCCRHASRFAEELGAAGFEVLNEVVLNQVLVCFGDDAATQRVVAALQADGTCWCGLTRWQGRAAMRISVCSWATTDEDVTRSLEAMRRVARAVLRPPPGP